MPASTSDAPAEIIRYQKQRPLSECPGFVASLQIEAGSEGAVFVGLRSDALEIYTAGDVQFLYDLEGRLLRFSTPNEYRFRGVSHQGTVARKRSREAGGGFERTRLDAATLDQCCRAAWAAGVRTCEALEGDRALQWAHPDPAQARACVLPRLRQIREWTPERLAAESAHFAQVYQPVPILPPDHYASLVLQATEGCSFNTCTFCALYRGTRYRVRSDAEFAQHVRAALSFHGEGLKRFTQIFLGQANALAVPQARLVRLFEVLRQYVELPRPGAPRVRTGWALGDSRRFVGVGSFLDGFTGLMKSTRDYVELRELGLVRTYLGVETGSAELLRWLEKPATPAEMLETLRRQKGAGLATDVILLVGVGGARFAPQHVRDSLEFLRASPLQRGDRVFLSELAEYSTAPYAANMDAVGWPRLTPEEIARQKQELIDGIRRLGWQAVPYRIEPFVY